MCTHSSCLVNHMSVSNNPAQYYPTKSGDSLVTELPPALAGKRIELRGTAGRLNLYENGGGPPLLLVHSVNAAASAAEVRPLFEYYGARRRVFALDLPGFGFSDRTPRPYTVRLMTDAIHDAYTFIREQCGAVPVDALAVSLSCEFLARAAVEGAAFHSLALVSPTGFTQKPSKADTQSGSNEPWLHKLLTRVGLGRPLFRLLTRPSVIRYFLKRTWGSAQIDERLWRYDVLTTEQPGAEHAPLYFVSGALFSPNIVSIYQQLDMPVWMSKGTLGDFGHYPYAARVETRSNWRHSTFAAGALPYFEKLDAFSLQYDSFLELAHIDRL
jgi:pimeloyl-ACP methyl ester carboxylesterase